LHVRQSAIGIDEVLHVEAQPGPDLKVVGMTSPGGEEFPDGEPNSNMF